MFQASVLRNVLSLAVIIFLPVACGGGGGGSASSSAAALNSVTDLQAGGDLGVARTDVNRAFDSAATGSPRQGSVTQSSNTQNMGGMMVTRDTANVEVREITPGAWRYTFTNTLGGDSWRLSSSDAEVVDFLDSADGDFEGQEGSNPSALSVLGSLHGAIMARQSQSELEVVAVISNRHSGMSEDYLSMGLWGRISVTPGDMFGRISVGTFADGGDFDYSGLSPSGTANYEGVSIAIYEAVHGDGPAVGGLLYGDVDLTADFGRSMIDGTIRNFEIVGIDNSEEFDDPPVPVTVMLQDATIDGDGFFRGDTDIMLDGSPSPEVRQTYEQIIDNGADPLGGRWGGQFFGRTVGSGNQPGLVGGTWGVENDDIYMLGTFAAGHESRTPP